MACLLGNQVQVLASDLFSSLQTTWIIFSFPEFFFCHLKKFFFKFLAALGLRCCARAFCSCGEQGLLFIVVCGLLIVVASLVAEHGL